MLKTVMISILFFVLIGKSIAQSHDHVWLFGYDAWAPEEFYGGSVIDFNTEPPTVFQQDKEMDFDMTMASVCDSSGVLQFYTNGIAINDITHQTMINGDSLNPGELAYSNVNSGYATLNSHIILPNPGHPNLYALFHLKYDHHPIFIYANTTLYATTVDMNLNNGLGEVVSKNQEILTNGKFGIVAAVKHANGRDWWVWVTDMAENKYQVFLLSPNGFSEPYEYSAQPSFYSISLGQIIFPPMASKQPGTM